MKYPRLFLVFLLGLCVFGYSFFASTPVHAAVRMCRPLIVPVALGAGQSAQYNIYGELCHPTSGPSNTVQLLVPGGSYSHVYWDFPYQPQTYSYVKSINAAGYSTFNIDRIGIGQSSHPLLSLVTITMDVNAYVLHQLVQGLRNGTIGSHAFSRIIEVGHSLGSVATWVEAGTYHDVDGVIITGLLHHLNTVKLASVVGTLYPATLDPRFSSQLLNVNYTGYLTTEPGTRVDDFYNAPDVEPNVLAADEASKETATPGEFDSFATPLIDGISYQITVPVLVVVGLQDSLFCGLQATDCTSAATIQQAEVAFYSPQAQLQVFALAGSGHNLNLHRSAPNWFAAARTWASEHVAP